MDFALSDEQVALADTLRLWVDKHCPKDVARHLERQELAFPYELWDQMADAGLHGIGIDERYGGQGGDVTTQTVVARALARSLAGLTWIWGISSFAGGKSVGLYGTEEQKQRFLPELAAGRLRFAIAVTEPAGGTDVLGAMTTRARQVPGGWRITGAKTWSTCANVSDYLLLLARSQPDPARKTDGLTLFLVPQPSEGLETRPIHKLGMRCIPSFEVFLDDVFVPDDLVLGPPGQAWRMLTGTLNNERIVLASLCCGILDGVLESAVEHVAQRRAFGRPVGELQAVQHFLADIAMWQAQAELVTMRAAWLQSQGRPCATEANMAKLLASEYAVAAADLGIQMLGGMGYSADTDMQRYWRDARIYRIAPISNEMVRNVVAESLGLGRSF